MSTDHTTDETNRVEFTEPGGADPTPPEAPHKAASTPPVRLSDLFLGLTVQGVFRPDAPPAGSKPVSRQDVSEAFCRDTRSFLDAIDFDGCLQQAIAESAGGDVRVSPWWIVGLGGVMLAFNAWGYGRLLHPKKPADKKDTKEPTPAAQGATT